MLLVFISSAMIVLAGKDGLATIMAAAAAAVDDAVDADVALGRTKTAALLLLLGCSAELFASSAGLTERMSSSEKLKDRGRERGGRKRKSRCCHAAPHRPHHRRVMMSVCVTLCQRMTLFLSLCSQLLTLK